MLRLAIVVGVMWLVGMLWVCVVGFLGRMTRKAMIIDAVIITVILAAITTCSVMR